MTASRWRLLLLGAAVLLLVAAGSAYWIRAQAPQAKLTTARVERGDITVTVSANGTLNPVTLVNVGTQVSGTVRRLNVDFNSRVERGQVLAELDDSVYSAAVRQSEANLRSAAAQAALADANARRAEALFTKGYIAQQDLDQARQLAASAAAQRDLAHAQGDRDRANLGYTIIRSPVSGVVVSREVDVGQTVAASFQTPTLFKIAQDLSKMQIDSSFAEADVGRIRVGETVRFNVDAFADRTFGGTVSQVRLNPTTVQNVVTYDVVVAVDNPEQILLPGMTAYVNVVLSERHGVLKVPNAALRFKPPDADGAATAPTAPAGAGAARDATPRTAAAPGALHTPGGRSRRVGAPRTIYVVREGRALPLQVQLGGTDRRYTEVTGGDLREGDEVAVGLAAGANGAAGQTPRMRMF